jgi:hypothetical protein
MAERTINYRLNNKQLHLLILLYKFRFITIPYLAHYTTSKPQVLQQRCNVLINQQYLKRDYNLTYKMDRRPAIYYLSAKGIAALKQDERTDQRLLHAYYKNKSLSDEYKRHCVDTLAVYNILKATYGDAYEIFTRQEIAYFDDMPVSKPDLYLRGPKEYFIILAHDTQPFLVRKQLADYITHYEEEGWARGDYPALLFIFTTIDHQRAFLKHAANVLESAGIGDDELRIGATVMGVLYNTAETSAVWSFAGDASAPVSLSE